MIRFRGFKVQKSKHDGQIYFWVLFLGADNTDRFVSVPVTGPQRCGPFDLIGEDLRNYMRAECILSNVKEATNGS